MKICICFNQVPAQLRAGEAHDRISEQGAEVTAHAVESTLTQLGYKTSLVALRDDIMVFANALLGANPDIIFNLCEGFWGNARQEMHVAAMLELLGIPFTGAAALCLGLTQDKLRTKDLLRVNGLPTPRYLSVRLGEKAPSTHKLVYPLIVKPRFEDASLGIGPESVVENERDLKRRVAYIHKTYQQSALVEEFIEGRELNVSVLGDASMEPLPTAEIIFNKSLSRSLVGYAAKWVEESQDFIGTRPVCPAVLEPPDKKLVRYVAARACRIMNCRDYARIDIRLRQGAPYILEINANPDISPDAGLARSAAVGGISYPQLIERVITMAAQRKERIHAKP